MIAPHITAPKEDCPPPENCSLDDCPWIIASGQLTQRLLPPDNIPLEIAAKENCFSDDLSPTYYLIAPRKPVHP